MSPSDRQLRTSPAQMILDLAQAESLRADSEFPEGVTEMLPRVLDPISTLVRELRGATDIHGVARTILLPMMEFFNADRGAFFLGGAEEGGLVPVLALNRSGRPLGPDDQVSRTILSYVSSGGKPIIENALADPELSRTKSAWLKRMQSVLCVRPSSQSGQLGVFCLVARGPGRFTIALEPTRLLFESIAAMALENALLHHGDAHTLARRQTPGSIPDPTERILGMSRAIGALRSKASVAAMLEQPVLLLGEAGTGRRTVARVIHDASHRANEPFVALDCDDFPRPELKATLLGRTGAGVRQGLWPEAGLVARTGRGSLYLTAADRLTQELCTALRGIAQHGVFRPLGGRQGGPAHLRLLLAARADAADSLGRRPGLDRLQQELQPIVITLPPLRERREDIPILALHFARSLAVHAGHTDRPSFSTDALELLQLEPWPGNVRELQQTVLHILVTHRGPSIESTHVRDALKAVGAARPGRGASEPARAPSLRDWEQELIQRTLRETGGNKGEAARKLGIHRNTLTLKLKAMKGQPPAAS